MNMLAFDPIRAMSHDFLRVCNILQYLQNCIKSEAVVKLEKGELGRRRVTSEQRTR